MITCLHSGAETYSMYICGLWHREFISCGIESRKDGNQYSASFCIFPLKFFQSPQLMGWYHPHSGLLFLSQLNVLGNTCTDILRGFPCQSPR